MRNEEVVRALEPFIFDGFSLSSLLSAAHGNLAGYSPALVVADHGVRWCGDPRPPLGMKSKVGNSWFSANGVSLFGGALQFTLQFQLLGGLDFAEAWDATLELYANMGWQVLVHDDDHSGTLKGCGFAGVYNDIGTMISELDAQYRFVGGHDAPVAYAYDNGADVVTLTGHHPSPGGAPFIPNMVPGTTVSVLHNTAYSTDLWVMDETLANDIFTVLDRPTRPHKVFALAAMTALVTGLKLDALALGTKTLQMNNLVVCLPHW